MEPHARPSSVEMPQKRARLDNNTPTALPGLPDAILISILRHLPLLTQIRTIPLVSRAWNSLLWTHAVEYLDFHPFKEKMNDAIAMRLLSKCSALQSLTLKHCGVTDETISKLPTMLLHLDLSWCSRLSSECYKNLPQLQSLTLSWCSNVKDISMRLLPTSLVTLKLGGCSDLTDEGLKHIEQLSSLTSLQVSGCDKLTGRWLAHIPPTLRVLEAFTCPGISEEELRKLPPRIHVLGRAWPELTVRRGGTTILVSQALQMARQYTATLSSSSALKPVANPRAAAAGGPSSHQLPTLTSLASLHLHPTPMPPTAATTSLAALHLIPPSFPLVHSSASSSSSSSSLPLPPSSATASAASLPTGGGSSSAASGTPAQSTRSHSHASKPPAPPQL